MKKVWKIGMLSSSYSFHLGMYLKQLILSLHPSFASRAFWVLLSLFFFFFAFPISISINLVHLSCSSLPWWIAPLFISYMSVSFTNYLTSLFFKKLPLFKKNTLGLFALAFLLLKNSLYCNLASFSLASPATESYSKFIKIEN